MSLLYRFPKFHKIFDAFLLDFEQLFPATIFNSVLCFNTKLNLVTLSRFLKNSLEKLEKYLNFVNFSQQLRMEKVYLSP